MTTQAGAHVVAAAHGFTKGARTDFSTALQFLIGDTAAVPFEPADVDDVPDDSPQDEGDFTDAFRES